MKHLVNWLVAVFILTASINANAQDVMIARSKLAFPEAMSALQNTIIEHSYTLSRVQRIDIGLTKAGYKTDMYRVVFFGKHEELKWMSDKYPGLAAYLPMKIAIFAEQGETVAVALNPKHYSDVENQKKLNIIFRRWENDIKSILSDFRKAD